MDRCGILVIKGLRRNRACRGESIATDSTTPTVNMVQIEFYGGFITCLIYMGVKAVRFITSLIYLGVSRTDLLRV